MTQWVDNVQLASGALRSEAHVPVAVARNGQQFDVSTNRSYGYQAPTVASAVAPRAAHAATPAAVVVRGANLFGGALACVGHACSSGYRCRFGNVTVDAARNASDGSLRCVAPPQPDADGPLPLAVSLNGGDDFGAPIPFDYLGAAVASCTPAAVAATRRGGGNALAAAEAPTAAALCSGPTAGGARVVLRGAALHRGHDRECRFGDAAAVPASRVEGGGVECVAPPAARNGTANGTVPLALSLNGQDVAAATTVNFTYWEPPVPLSIWPPAGPADGRTAVTIRGAGFGGGGALLQCRFGEAAVVAEPNASDGTLVCVAPPAARARRHRRGGSGL